MADDADIAGLLAHKLASAERDELVADLDIVLSVLNECVRSTVAITPAQAERLINRLTVRRLGAPSV